MKEQTRLATVAYSVFLLMMLSCLPLLAEEAPALPAGGQENAEKPGPDATPARPQPGAGESKDGRSGQELYVPDIGETVVTASRTAEEPFLSERSIDIINAREIEERQPRTVPEALRESPGVFVQETNSGGGSPIVRGMVGPQILLLIDGIRLNNAVFRTGPLQYLNLLDQNEMERLEVVRGPGSILYGSDALGATINAITFSPRDRRAQDGPGFNFRLAGRYGSAAKEKTGAAMADAGRSWFGAGATGSFKDFENLEGGRGVGVQPYSSYRQANASAKLMARVPDGFFKDWTAVLGYHMARMMDAGRADQLESKGRYNIYQNDYDLAYGRGGMIFKRILTDLELTLYFSRFYEGKETDQLDTARAKVKTRTDDRMTVNTGGADLKINTRLFEDRLKMVYGGEYHKDFVSSSSHSVDPVTGAATAGKAVYPKGTNYELGGAYLSVQGELLPLIWNWGLRLTAGYRLQYMGGRADARDTDPAVDYSNLANIFMAGVQGSYKRHWMGAFTWSQGFRAPNLDETAVIGDRSSWYQVPNNRLGPERSNTLELLNRFDAWRLSGSLAAYVTLMSDFIRREPAVYNGQDTVNGLQVQKNINGGEAHIYGIEGQIRFRMWWGFSLYGSVTYTYGEELLGPADREKDPAHRDCRPISRIPPLFGDAGLRWDNRFNKDVKFFAETFFLFADRQGRLSDTDLTDPRIPKGGTPGWITWNFRSGLELYDIARLVLSLENLTNIKYKYHGSGVYGAGTNAMLTAVIHY